MSPKLAMLAALGVLLAGAAQARPQNVEFGLLGRSMHMQLVSGNSSVDVRVGKVYEVDSAGNPVPGHRLPSLASLQPAVSNGTKELNGTTFNYVTLSITGFSAIPNFASACPAGSTPPSVSVPVADASVNVTFFHNISGNVSFPYGDGFVDVSPGAVKFNIDAAGWPFCAADNKLMLELALATSVADDEPVLFDEGAAGSGDDDDAPSTGAATPNATDAVAPQQPVSSWPVPSSGGRRHHMRRLMEPAAGRGRGREVLNAANSAADAAGDDDGKANAASGSKSLPAQQQGKRPPARPNAAVAPPRLREDAGAAAGRRRDPSGRKPRLVAALLSPEAAAALDLQTVAYDAAASPTRAYNVSVYAPGGKAPEDGPAPGGGAPRNVTRIVLGFPYFEAALHYDPTVAVDAPESLGYANASDADLAAVSAPMSNDAGFGRRGAPAGALAPAALGAAALLLFVAG